MKYIYNFFTKKKRVVNEKGLKIFSSSLLALTFALGNLDNTSANASSYDINNIEDLKAEIVKLNEIPSVKGEESKKKIDKRQDIINGEY